MRYDIVCGILLLFSIIDFALAAPVLVQEKHQTSVDEVHMPRDVITVLGKRMDDDFEEFSRFVNGYFKPWKELVASSSSAPPGLDHGSTNAVQAPVPDLAPSDAHAPSSSAPPGPDHGSTKAVQAPVPDLAPSVAHAPSSSAPPAPDHGSMNVMQQTPAPDPVASTANPIPLVELLSSDSESESEPIASSALLDSKNKWLFEPQEVGHMIDFSQPIRKKRPWIDLDPDPDPNPGFVSDFWTSYRNRPRPGSASPKETGQTSEDQAGHVQAEQPDPGPSRESGFDLNDSPVPEPVVHPPSTSAELPTLPEHEVVTPSESSPNPTQPVDSQAAIYAAQRESILSFFRNHQ